MIAIYLFLIAVILIAKNMPVVIIAILTLVSIFIMHLISFYKKGRQ